jgi:hypothetical protein
VSQITGHAREDSSALKHCLGDDVRHHLPGGVQGVTPDHVDGDELGVPLVPGYASVSGVTRRADLLGVGFEVLGADSRATPYVCALTDFSWPYPQDEREPSGAGMQPRFPAQFLEAMPGYQTPEAAYGVPACIRNQG